MNLKTIIEDFKRIQENHLMINSFGTGDLKQLIYLTQEKFQSENTNFNAPVYPLMYVIPNTVNRTEHEITYNFNVLICDIMSTKTYDIETQLLSDTLMMCEDVLAQFKYSIDTYQGDYEFKYDISLPSTISPFTESYDDYLVGWNVPISLVIGTPLNRCLAPFRQWETPSCDIIPPEPSGVTPTPTPTNTVTPTTTPTPTVTPTPTTAPVYSFNVEYDGSLDNLCSGSGTINLTVYGTNSTFENNTILYLDNDLSIFAPIGYCDNSGTTIEIVLGGVVSGVVVCPSPTPTPSITPTMTMTPTPTSESVTPTMTPTPTLTPTPSSTPATCYEAGAGFSAPVTWVETITGSTYIMTNGGDYQGSPTNNMIKLNSDLTVDATWNTGGIQINPTTVGQYFIDNNNRIILTGGFTTIQSTTRNRMARLHGDTGLLDTTFDFGGSTGFGNNSVLSVASTSDGGYVCVGSFTTINGVTRNRIVKLTSTGAIDATFNVGTGFNTGNVNWIKETSDGKFICSGSFATYNGTSVSRVCRLNSDGSLDATYLPSLPNSPSQAYRFVLLSDDSVVVFQNASPGLVKIDNTGTVDSTFQTNIGTGGDTATALNGDIQLLPSNQIMIARFGLTFNNNYAGEFVVLNSDGTRDTSVFTGTNFGDITSGVIRVRQRSNGTLIFVGAFFFFNTQLENRIMITDSSGNELMCS